MGKDCRAGWVELQNYRQAKAILWLHAEENVAKMPQLKYATVFWDWRGHTEASGACFFVTASHVDGSRAYPITSPKKASGTFSFKNNAHAAMLRADLEEHPRLERTNIQVSAEQLDRWIADYERVAAPLGSWAWLRYDAYPRTDGGSEHAATV